MGHLGNKTNEYVWTLPTGIFDRIPKTVWAAISLSLAMRHVDRLNEALRIVMDEWQALYDNGIVPQKPFQLK